MQSRRQSSRLRGAKRLSGGPKFEIKHKSCFPQKSKLIHWEGKACLGLGQINEMGKAMGGARAPLSAGSAYMYAINRFSSSLLSVPIFSMSNTSLHFFFFFNDFCIGS